MAKFNTVVRSRTVAAGPVQIDRAVMGVVTHEGAPAFARTPMSELFMLGVANFVGEGTFYESAEARDERYARLVREVAVSEVDWLVGFVRWLRNVAGLRSAPLVAAAEAVHARRAVGLTGRNRELVDASIGRADEPGEFLAYWRSRFGRSLPSPVKNGLADAVRRVWSEYTVAKYDTAAAGYRFGDVVEAVHPRPWTPAEAELFEHLLARRHGRAEVFRGAGLPLLRARAAMGQIPVAERRALLADSWELFRAAGMTWEAVSGWLEGPMDKAAWEAVIPHMGLFALARNVRNFDQAGVSDRVAAGVAARFADAEKVAKAGIFPYQWLAAYEAAPSLRWSYPLDQALNASVACVPALDGPTLVLVDTSASMTRAPYSAKSKMAPVKNAAIFGAALALRNPDTDLVGFATGTFEHRVPKGTSLLTVVSSFTRRVGEVDHGTEIAASIRARFRPGYHRRVFVIIFRTTKIMNGLDPRGNAS
jgi:hypothetical protein